jgi:trimeric autotransporter adhesin
LIFAYIPDSCKSEFYNNNKIKHLQIHYKIGIPLRLLFLIMAISHQNIRESVIKADDLRLHPVSVVFNAVEGHSLSATRSIFLFTAQGTSLSWNLTKDASWITTSATSGTTEAVLKIGVNTSGLQAGTYSGNVTVQSPASGAGALNVAVYLIINPDVSVIITPWKDGIDAAMSVTVDDSYGSGFTVLQSNGFKGTYYMAGSSPPSFATSYYNAGMELSSHTVNHPCYTVSDNNLRNQEIVPNISGICTYTPEPCKDVISMAWPCGFTNYREQAIISEYFLSARGYNFNQLEETTPENFMNLKSYNSHEHDPIPPTDLKTVVDTAVMKRKWFNMVLHSLTNDDGAITYAHSKNIWVAPVGTVIKYILQRDRFILTNYTSGIDRITYNVSRLQVPASPVRTFEDAFGINDSITMQIDVDDARTVENVFVDGSANPYKTKNISGNIVLLANIKPEPGVSKAVEIRYHVTSTTLTVSGVTANDKVYDRTTSASINISGAALAGVIGNDDVTLVKTGATGTFSNKNVGSGKIVSITGFSITGADADKYTLIQPVASASITAAVLTVTGVTASDKIYNGTTAATLVTVGATLAGIIGSDNVTLVTSGAAGSFASKNAGSGKTVTTSGFTISGTDAGNYVLTQPMTTASITAASLTISGVTASDKIYDRSVAATLNKAGAALSGIVTGDAVTLVTTGATGVFADKNAGTGKTVTASGFTISGTDAGNYALIQPILTARINPASVTVSGITANNKVYDASIVAVLNSSGASLSGVLSGDNATLTVSGATGTFADKNVGTAKSVTITGLSLSGTDAGNYTIQQTLTSASITSKELTVGGSFSVNNKVYDGTVNAIITINHLTLINIAGNDNVTLAAVAVFEDNNIGIDKTVRLTGSSLTGIDAANYTLSLTGAPTTTATIVQYGLTIKGVTAANKIYDRTTVAVLNASGASLEGVSEGDDVTLITTGATGSFAEKNVGTGKTVSTSGFSITGTDAGKYLLIQPTATANITPVTLTISGVTALNKVYNGTTGATLNTGSAALTGVLPGDAVFVITSGATGTFSSKNTGTGKTVTASGFTLSGADAGNYTLIQPSTTASITAAGLTISGVTASNKVYDGTTASTLNTAAAALVGVVTGDAVTLVKTGATGTFADKNIGTGKTVTVTGFSVSGTDAGNYTLTQPATTASITVATLTISGVTAGNKVYDRSTTATINTGSAALAGVKSGDAVTLVKTGVTGYFANKNVGTGKAVTITGFTLSGTDAGNYTLTQPSATANITALGLTITGVTAGNKVYDGTTSATLNTTAATLSGVVTGDAVTLVKTGVTGTFASKTAGTGKPITTSGFSISGTDAGNYTLTQPTTTANITALGLTIQGVTAGNKVYDGTTSATLNSSAAALSGVISGDAVTLVKTGATGTFANRNVGTGKTVTISGFTLSGTDAGNYTLTQPITTANITALGLTISGVTASNKVYDGTTSATLNTSGAALSGVISGDAVTLVKTGITGTFSSKTAGTGKTIATSGFSISGTDAGNYTLTQPTATANITASVLTISGVSANNKVYDGTTAVILNATGAALNGIVTGDAVTLVKTGATGTFASRNVGTGKAVTVTGFTISGTDAGNYTLTQPDATANITAAALTITGVTAGNKVYNGTTAANLNTTAAVLSGVMTGDAVTLVKTGVTGTFASKNVGTGKAVTVTGFTISGTDAANYTLTQPATTANITPSILTITGITANNKVYDGTTSATIKTSAAALSGVIAGDDLYLITSAVSGTFADRNAGTVKTVTTSGFTISGNDAGNYLLTQPSATAGITPRVLNIGGSFTADDKAYDGTTDATITTSNLTLINIAGSDNVMLIAVAAFEDIYTGTDKTVSLTGSSLAGTDAPNYVLSLTDAPTSTATITLFGLTVTGIRSMNKVYDGNTDAIINTDNAALKGFLPGDDVVLVTSGAKGKFADKNKGTGKIVKISGLTLSGADAGKYTVIHPATTATITEAGLTISGIVAVSKAYDGTKDATLNTSEAYLNGVVPGDSVTLVTASATGIFADKNAGSGKSVSTSGFTLRGADASNYSLEQPSSSADINAAGLTVAGISAAGKIYDGTDSVAISTEAATLAGLVPGDIVSLVSTGTTARFEDRNAGNGKKVITSGFAITGADTANYYLVQPLTTADILPKELTVTANNFSKSYGDSLVFQGTEITVSGLVPGDTVPPVIIRSTGVPASAPAGTYAINVSAGTGINYIFTCADGVLTVSKSKLTAAAGNTTKVYGSSDPVLSITWSGFKNNDDISVIDTLPVASTNALPGSSTGTYQITLSGGSDDNYDIELVNGTLEIIKAPLTVTAENKTRIYNQPNPALTFTISGFIPGENKSVINLLPVASTAATTGSDAGSYDITVSGAADDNYSFNYVKGTLTVNRADQTISFDRITASLRISKKYKLTAAASSGLPVRFISSDPGTGSITGNILSIIRESNLTVTALQDGDNNWNPAPSMAQQVEIIPPFDNVTSLFTPNNDGVNDYWYIPDLDRYGRVQVTVYNRYGKIVYSSDGYKNDWDGVWNGNPLPSGSYYYVIKSSVKGFIKGVVNIVR